MSANPKEKELAKRNAQLEKENELLRDLVSVLRELPGNRGRDDLPQPPVQAEKEAGATKPRKTKSKPEPRAVPGDPRVGCPPSSAAR